MKGDFTRFSHQPARHYAAVLMQQGRVQLDADWNEELAIQDHRWRVQTIDTIGACGVPIHAGGFEITLAGGDLAISAGRIYVDGLLGELDQVGVTYTTQPDYPTAGADSPLNPVDGRRDLIYLDVWRRHVTAVEDPAIREVALGGPDTATRLQMVCQVKVLQNGPADCDDAMVDWDNLVAPSPARMSAQAAGVTDPNDPCLIAPGAGYRGLENRLYRVEIHAGGPLGTATFKWSRDNGSLVTGVENFIGGALNQIQVANIGRDQVMRFKIGDWVEVLGDETELAGRAGTMAQITGVDEAQRTLSLSVDASAHSAEARPRVRRWDQAAASVITAGPWIDLEDGVQVGFSAGPFKPGDYWVIPARTAVGDVEGFVDSPLRGIRHRYCRLALVTWHVSAAGDITAEIDDCRKPFPPLTELPTGGAGCCTVTVGDGVTSVGQFTDIQAAVDSLAETGGRVCILPGEYRLESPVVVGVSKLIVSGCGWQARISAPNGLAAFRVEDSSEVTLESLYIQATAPLGAIRAVNSRRLSVLGCTVVNKAGQAGLAGVAVQAQIVRLDGNRLIGGGLWVEEGSAGIMIRDNEIMEGRGAGIALGSLLEDQKAPDDVAGITGVVIRENHIHDMGCSGISTVAAQVFESNRLGDLADVLIADNRIRACAQDGPISFYDSEAVGGIVLRGSAAVRIHANQIVGNGASGKFPACGLFVHGCLGLAVTDNVITENGAANAGPQSQLYQGGIIALYVAGGALDLAGKLAEDASFQSGWPAALLADNVVTCPAGQALLVLALGPVSVMGNNLTSLGLGEQPLALTRLGRSVFIFDLGRTPLLSNAMAAFGAPVGLHVAAPTAGTISLGQAAAARTGFPDGRVLFHGNQVTFQASRDTPLAFEGAVAILSLDDVGLQDNQVLVETDPGAMLADVAVLAASIRASGNRFTELPMRSLFSYFASGTLHIATGNQATHCMLVKGAQVIDTQNQVLITTLCELLQSLFKQIGG